MEEQSRKSRTDKFKKPAKACRPAKARNKNLSNELKKKKNNLFFKKNSLGNK